MVYYHVVDSTWHHYAIWYGVYVWYMAYEDKDPTNHGFWNPRCLGPWNKKGGSLCLCGLLGALHSAIQVRGGVKGVCRPHWTLLALAVLIAPYPPLAWATLGERNAFET